LPAYFIALRETLARCLRYTLFSDAHLLLHDRMKNTKATKCKAASEAVQVSCRVGYFGLPGSFSHEMAICRFPDASHKSFEEMAIGFEKLRSEEMDKIVVPFENSIGGAITDTLDQLILLENWEKDFCIQEQLVYEVSLCLLGRVPISKIKRIYSHFVPLTASRPWIQKNFPSAKSILSASTSAAAKRAAKDSNGAAVGNAGAAPVYKLKVLARDITPPSTNVTRFLVVGSHSGIGVAASHDAPSARGMVHLRLPNKSGALADVLQMLKRSRINLTQILSRPVQGKPGQHQFLLEMDLPEKGAPKKISDLWSKMKKSTRSLHLLGVYPVRPMNFQDP